MGKIKYGEFTFNKPTERASIPGYAYGGKIAPPGLLPSSPRGSGTNDAGSGRPPISSPRGSGTNDAGSGRPPTSGPRRPPPQAIDMPKPNMPKPNKPIGSGVNDGSLSSSLINDLKASIGTPKPNVPMKKGGKVHEDVKMDKAGMKKAVHKHESHMHPGKPMTKLKKGGVPTHNRSPKVC